MNEAIIDKWQRIFEMLLLKDTAVITDLLPGDDPKVELALASSGFSGTLKAVDRSNEALSRLADYVGKVGAKYRFEAVNADILTDNLPQSDYIVGNHIIDDLLSYSFCQRESLDPSKMRVDPHFSRQVWDAICDSRQGHDLVRTAIENIVKSLKNGGVLILSSYVSKFEREHRFEHETGFCRQLFDELRQYVTGRPYIIDWSGFLKASVQRDPKLNDQWIAIQRIN